MSEPLELTPDMEVDKVAMVQRIFEGRMIDPNSEGMQPQENRAARPHTANESKNVPLEKMYRCQAENPGCGLSKPANAFYKEIQTLCSECAVKLARKHAIDLYWVPMALNCYDITRRLAGEAKALATPEGQEKGWTALVVNHGIEAGRNRFVERMIEGTQRAPTEMAWVVELHEKYKGWLFGHYDIPKEKYSNIAKNGLLP